MIGLLKKASNLDMIKNINFSCLLKDDLFLANIVKEFLKNV